MKVQTGQGKYQFSLIESHMILWKMWSKKLRIWLFEAILRKSVLWVSYRIRQIWNRTSDEEVIKKRKLRNQRENEKKGRRNGNDDDCGSGKWRCVFIKVTNIHFNPPSKLAFKSNSFSYNLVLNCNLVRKLIPN